MFVGRDPEAALRLPPAIKLIPYGKKLIPSREEEESVRP